MPKHYTMGGRAAQAAAPGQATSPAPRSLRERVGALRNLPPFLRLVWQTSPLLARRRMRASPGPRAAAGGDALRRQADHRRGGRAGPDAGHGRRRSRNGIAAGLLDRIGGLLLLEFGLAVFVGRAGTHGLAARFAAVRAIQQRHQPAADGARGDARPRGLRGQRIAGSAGARAPAGHGADDADRPAVRPGAGHGDDRQLRRRAGRVRAVADRAAGGRAGAGVRRRGAFQRAKLFAQLRAHRRAARARLRPADRRQRRDREGSQDLRPQPLPDRSLPATRRRLLPGEPDARAAPRRLGQPADRHRHDRVLRRLRLHRLAHAARRVHDRRSDVSLRLVPPPAHACWRTC